MEDHKKRVIWLGDMLKAVAGVCYSMVNADGDMSYSNMPYLEIFHLFLSLDGNGQDAGERLDELQHRIRTTAAGGREQGMPHVFTNELGMSYISVLEFGVTGIERIHVFGPVFLEEISQEKIRRQLDRLQLSVPVRHHLLDVLGSCPAVSLNRFYEYGMMLYHAVTQENVRVDEFQFSALGQNDREGPEQPGQRRYRGQFWREERMLALVEEGNPKYREEMAKIFPGEDREELGETYIRQVKNRTLVFTALCSRAAVRGGMDPETAFALRERFLDEIEACRELGQVNEIRKDMLETYVRRVRERKTQEGVSAQILAACDHIALHPEETVTAAGLAEKVGYSDYYFTYKFKKETGMTLHEYVRKKRIEIACELLRGTAEDIEHIGMQVGFASRSYFGKVFKDLVGVTPTEYREGKRRKADASEKGKDFSRE